VKLPKIQHPDWIKEDFLPGSNIENTLRLYRQGKLPESIAGQMIAVAAKRPLRAVYGSNLRAGWALICDSLEEKFHAFRYRFGLLTRQERKEEKLLDILDDEDGL